MTKRFVAAIFALTAVAAASTGGASAHSLTSPATVRSGPGIQWPTIAQIPAGANVGVSGCYSGWEGGWRQVKWRKVNGYVQAGALAASGANNVIGVPPSEIALRSHILLR